MVQKEGMSLMGKRRENTVEENMKRSERLIIRPVEIKLQKGMQTNPPEEQFVRFTIGATKENWFVLKSLLDNSESNILEWGIKHTLDDKELWAILTKEDGRHKRLALRDETRMYVAAVHAYVSHWAEQPRHLWPKIFQTMLDKCNLNVVRDKRYAQKKIRIPLTVYKICMAEGKTSQAERSFIEQYINSDRKFLLVVRDIALNIEKDIKRYPTVGEILEELKYAQPSSLSIEK